MVDNTHPLLSVLSQLCTPARADGRAPVIAVTSTHSGVGSSYVARNLSLLAAAHYQPFGHRAALIDLDLGQQSQTEFFENPGQHAVYGALNGPYDATFGVAPFWQVSPDGLDSDGNRKSAAIYGSLHLVGQTGLAVTRFNWTEVKDGQSVHIQEARDYWHALRDQFAVVIVDTPAFDRGDTALTVTTEADKTIIVCDAARAADPAQKALSDKITENGGRCAGLVVNTLPIQAQGTQMGA